MLIDFEPGDFVTNLANKDWGVGQVQSIIGNKVTVNFENCGKKVINIENINLEKINNEKGWTEINHRKIDWNFSWSRKESINLFSKGLKIKIKEDKSPVSNGDLEVDKIITDKIKKLTPNIPIISEETVDLKLKILPKYFG